jgi:GT2 family glycosyltransferase
MKAVHLGIVIVSWNVCKLLDECLQSLRTAIAETPLRNMTASIPTVVVVDNASQDNSIEMVKSKHPEVKLICSQQNMGYVEANNTAITYVLELPEQRPDMIWLLNPDTVVKRDTIPRMLNFMNNQPCAGLIGPKLLNADGTLQESAFHFPGIIQPLFDFKIIPQRFYYTSINGRYSRKKYESDKPFRIDHPLGAGMMARTKAIESVGLLDNAFFMYCEEIDWAWRMKKSGWESWLVPSATITHYGGASASQAKPMTTAYLWESRARLYRKHRGPIVWQLVSWLVRRHFSKQSAVSQEWETAYQRILSAWE